MFWYSLSSGITAACSSGIVCFQLKIDGVDSLGDVRFNSSFLCIPFKKWFEVVKDSLLWAPYF